MNPVRTITSYVFHCLGYTKEFVLVQGPVQHFVACWYCTRLYDSIYQVYLVHHSFMIYTGHTDHDRLNM
jgi:hypothetical protein